MNDEDIPVLYSAPESLLEDKYDFRTDTWMVGLLIYGLYTHCGVPYTVNGLTTDKILEYVSKNIVLGAFKLLVIPRDQNITGTIKLGTINL